MTTRAAPDLSTPELAQFAEQQRRQAAYAIARDLPSGSASIMRAIKRATTREEADVARNRAIGFGVMCDKLEQLTGSKLPGRYGGRGLDEAIDQASVLLALPPVDGKAPPAGNERLAAGNYLGE